MQKISFDNPLILLHNETALHKFIQFQQKGRFLFTWWTLNNMKALHQKLYILCYKGANWTVSMDCKEMSVCVSAQHIKQITIPLFLDFLFSWISYNFCITYKVNKSFRNLLAAHFL